MKVITDPVKIDRLLTRGVTEVIEREHLKQVLLSGKQLRVKLGIDPTSPDLHLGHAVVLRKLREFQILGHRAVLVIGDFTARIGDPTGRSKTRPHLSATQVKENMKGYLKQAGKVIDIKKTEVTYNSKWLEKMSFVKIYELSFLISASEILQRDDFKKRLEKHEPIRVHELYYPMMQAIDSIELKADVEIGGNDQLFNNLMGRSLMGRLKLKPQDMLTVELLEGTDGKEKMSKSLGNYIGLTDDPNNMFGKIMAVKDELIDKYFWLCTDLEKSEIAAITGNPKDRKLRLAFELVKIYHSEKAATAAQQQFNAVFGKKELPQDLIEVTIDSHALVLMDLVIAVGFAVSKGEARRLIEQGGVKVSEIKKTDPNETIDIETGLVIQVGPRRFVKIVRK